MIVLNLDGDVLQVCRPYTDTWGFPGGSVEKNETFYEAAIRETEEETGIKVIEAEYFFSDWDIVGNYTVTFLATSWKGEIINPEKEHGIVAEFGPWGRLCNANTSPFAKYNSAVSDRFHKEFHAKD